jgi:ubiquinol-cytochrome c reductase cytochrome c subunit
LRRTLVFVLLALGATACAYATPPPPHPYRPAIVAQPDGADSGEELYLRECAWCHGARGEGTPRAPDIITGTGGAALTDFMLSSGRMPLDYPEQGSRRRPPAFTEAQIASIVDYVSTFDVSGPDVPEVDLELGDLVLGQELYAENCAACHSTTLIGGALTSLEPGTRRTVNAPGLRSSTPTEVAEAMLTGPGAMPVFGSDTFTPQESTSIVRYVNALQDPRDRGGAPLGHVGPVTEGAVAWILGLGALLGVARWIGTRTGEKA